MQQTLNSCVRSARREQSNGSKWSLHCTYIPPRTWATHVAEFLEIPATEITAVKVVHGDPIIVVCWEFNGRDIYESFAVDDKISLVDTGPTKGPSTLNLIYTNMRHATYI